MKEYVEKKTLLYLINSGLLSLCIIPGIVLLSKPDEIISSYAQILGVLTCSVLSVVGVFSIIVFGYNYNKLTTATDKVEK